MKLNTRVISEVFALTLWSAAALAQYNQLVVVSNAGEVWGRTVTDTTVGAGTKLKGGLFGGPNDRFVFGGTDSLYVVNTAGELYKHQVLGSSVDSGTKHSGLLLSAGGTNDKYLLTYYGSCGEVYVVDKQGEAWLHSLDPVVGDGKKVSGPGLFGGPDDKYVVLDDSLSRILVITADGSVWAHDLSRKVSGGGSQNYGCSLDTVGLGYKLSGPGLFGGPNDKYVLFFNRHIWVINTMGEIWSHAVDKLTVGAGKKLSGPGLFSGVSDKYVALYYILPPPN